MSTRVCVCGNLTKNRVRCDRCAAKQKAKRYPRSREYKQRESGATTKAGYGSDWQKLRAAYLLDHPLCELCDEKGHVTPAEEVHHKVPISVDPSLRLTWENLQALCVPCHKDEDARLRRERKAPVDG